MRERMGRPDRSSINSSWILNKAPSKKSPSPCRRSPRQVARSCPSRRGVGRAGEADTRAGCRELRPVAPPRHTIISPTIVRPSAGKVGPTGRQVQEGAAPEDHCHVQTLVAKAFSKIHGVSDPTSREDGCWMVGASLVSLDAWHGGVVTFASTTSYKGIPEMMRELSRWAQQQAHHDK